MIIPKHVGFIMDGNGRWAIERGLPRRAGHRAGLEHIRHVLNVCHEHGIDIVSGYLWSTENWSRPKDEVRHIRYLLRTFGKRFADELHAAGVRIVHSGSRHGLSETELQIIDYAVELTQKNGPRIFNLVFNYGGRAELIHAAQQLCTHGLSPEDITEATITAQLYTAGLPDIDLIIRAGGDQRSSNFLLWQSSYAWFYTVPHYWPALDEHDVDAALHYYAHAIESRQTQA
jgi:undecaprenyl diphosphate synthase